MLVCSASGGGTTTILRTLTAQLLHHGAHALVLDLKRIPHRLARNLLALSSSSDVTCR